MLRRRHSVTVRPWSARARRATAVALTVAAIGGTALATAAPAGARPSRALASGSWEIGLSWAGGASLRTGTVSSNVSFLGSGSGTMLVDADSVAGPYGITMFAAGAGRATVGTRTAEGSSSDTTYSFTGAFGGSATEPCLTGQIELGGTFEYQDDLGLVVIPLDGITKPMTCAEWPLRIASVTCNVVEGEWAWLKTQGLLGAGFTFTGSPSRFWGVRTPPSAAGSAASDSAMRSLMDEANALASAQPISATDLRAFLRSARTRLPDAAPACGARQDGVELAVLTRVIIAQMIDQGTALPTDALIELADFAARVDAFARPQTDLSRTTATSLQNALTRLVDDSSATANQLADAADAARRLGWSPLANRLEQEAAAR